MAQKPTITFYISAHGYGHAVRQSFLINLIPQSYDVLIVSAIPESLFKEEVERPFYYRDASFDLGCVQIDAVTVDINATLLSYDQIRTNNLKRVSEEVDTLGNCNTVAIIADIVPFASTVANTLGVPSFAVSNFSWYETYKQYLSDSENIVLSSLYKEYTSFTHWVRLSPGTTLPQEFNGKESLSNVALLRKGRKCKAKICKHYSIDPAKKLVLLYTGTYGLDRVDWMKLESFSEYHFIGYYPLGCSPKNYLLVRKDSFTLQDFSASADLIISKLGYGTVSESLSSGTPFLYLPRENFIEFPALKADLEGFGSSLEIKEEKFNTLDIAEEMQVLLTLPSQNNQLKDSNQIIVDWILNRI